MNEDRKRLYQIWKGAKDRTSDPTDKDYPKYGARGIRMCKEWSEDFECFHEWALSHGYRKDLTIDRVNNNKGYEPGNCRWVSRKSQASNRHTNTFYTCRGRTMTLQKWSETTGVTPDRIVHRLEQGWSLEDALFKPVRAYKRR